MVSQTQIWKVNRETCTNKSRSSAIHTPVIHMPLSASAHTSSVRISSQLFSLGSNIYILVYTSVLCWWYLHPPCSAKQCSLHGWWLHDEEGKSPCRQTYNISWWRYLYFPVRCTCLFLHCNFWSCSLLLFLCAQPSSYWCSTRFLASLWLTTTGSWLVLS